MASIELALKIYDAFGRGDEKAMESLCHPDVEWIQNQGFPYGGHHRGPKAIMDGVYHTLRAHWDDFSFSHDEAHESGATAIFVGSYHGTHKQTGRQTEAAAVHVLEFSDGLLRRFRQYTDTKVIHDATDL